MEKVDVLVVGGGPSGSTVASLVAQAGLKVLVLEKEHFPRFHVGESMLPQSLKVWKRLGIVDQLHAHPKFLIKYGARFADATAARTQTYYFHEAFDPSCDFAFQVPRADFDDLLLRHSEKLGAEARHGWLVTTVIFEGTRAVGAIAKDSQGNSHEIRCRVLVDATGRDTLLPSRERTKRRYPELDKTAMFDHWEGVRRLPGRDEGNVEIVVWDTGWYWNIPFKHGVNSCGMSLTKGAFKSRKPGESLTEFYIRMLADAPEAQSIMAKAKPINPVMALADFSYRVAKYGGDGWVIVGDSAGFIDPLFSTGAHLAFQSGMMAADQIIESLGGPAAAVCEGDWAEYSRRLRFATDLFAGAVQAFYRGQLLERIFEQPQRKILRQTITSMLSGDVFNETVPWARFLQQHYPPVLPPPDGDLHPEGASPVLC